MVLRRVAVTGATGMVGRSLIELLEQQNISYVATYRSNPGTQTATSEWVKLDLSKWNNPLKLEGIFSDVQALFHLGAFVPRNEVESKAFHHLFDVNVRPCLSVAEWATKNSIPVVFLSSATVYANPERKDIRETDPTIPGTLGGFYSVSKLFAEQTFQYFIKDGLKITILRPTSIYGYGLPENKLITHFLLLAAQDKTIDLYPPVEDKVNLIHARDVSRAMIQALMKGSQGIFNIANREFNTIVEIAQACIRVVGKGRVEIIEADKTRPPAQRFGLNYDLANKTFGFKPTLDIEAGITLMWSGLRNAVAPD